MQTRNSPAAYGFIAGAIVLILGLFVNASCAHAPPPPRDPAQLETPTPARTLRQQTATAVEIITECGSGSGVLIDGGTVLTAFHVVDCGDGKDDIQIAKWLVIRTLDKKSSLAALDVGDPMRDLARLRVTTPFKNIPPVHIRAAQIGETVCAATAVPERSFRCGTVAEPDGSPREYGDVVVADANVWYGNSGSGVYASDGTLVGVMVRLDWCNTADAVLVALLDIRVDTCGGRVSSILDSPVRP